VHLDAMIQSNASALETASFCHASCPIEPVVAAGSSVFKVRTSKPVLRIDFSQ
jgi:hypothetical protein